MTIHTATCGRIHAATAGAIPAQRLSQDDSDADPVFPGGWPAAAAFYKFNHPTAQPANEDVLDGSVPQVPSRLRCKITDYLAIRRLNRAFRRHQREFDAAMDACSHDPAGQRELRSIWTLRG